MLKIQFQITANHDILNCNTDFIYFFGNPVGRKCYDILHGRMFPCAECPTFKVMETQIPQIRIWKKLDKNFRSTVKPTCEAEKVEETLQEIDKKKR